MATVTFQHNCGRRSLQQPLWTIVTGLPQPARLVTSPYQAALKVSEYIGQPRTSKVALKSPPGTGDFQMVKTSPYQAALKVSEYIGFIDATAWPLMQPKRAVVKADSTLRSSRAVPHPSTNRALRRLTSEVRRDPVYSTRYGRQRM